MLAVLAVVSVGTLGAGGAVADVGPAATATPPDARSDGTLFVNATAAGVWANVTTGGDADGTVWVTYRVAGADSWERTPPRNVSTRRTSRASLLLLVNVTGLQPATTYEYRVLLATEEGSDAGAVRTFTTAARSTDGAPSGGNTAPRPNGSPTPTRTPIPSETVGDRAPQPADASLADWLAGVVPLLAWAAAVGVVAPLVLAGLLWLDSLRAGRE